MLPRNRTPQSCKFLTHRSLLIAGESTLSHSPSYSVRNWVSHPAANRAGHSLSYPVRNPANCLDGNPASYRAGYSPENPTSYWESYRDSNSAGYSADCPDNRPERNPESNRADYSESYPADSLPGCSESYPEGFDPRPATEPAQVQESDRRTDRQLPQHHRRVPERGGDNATGHRCPRTDHARHHERSPADLCRPALLHRLQELVFTLRTRPA